MHLMRILFAVRNIVATDRPCSDKAAEPDRRMFPSVRTNDSLQ